MLRNVTDHVRDTSLTGALILLSTLIFQSPAIAVGTSVGAGTYGAPFLRIPVGARLMASPDIVAGMQPDASMAFSNPAFLSDINTTGLFVSTVNWLDDLRLSAASAAFPVGSAVFSVGTTFLYSGGLQGFDNSLNVVSEESFYDLGLTGSVSRRFGGLALGAGATYVREHIIPDDGSGVVFNLGASYDFGPNRVHVATRNIGGKVNFDAISYDIDSETVLGAGRIFETSMGKVFAGAQVRFSDIAENRFEVGVDYELNELLTVRAGLPDVTNSDGSSIQGGLGIHYGSMTVDYAYASRDFFSAAHTLSFTFSLDGRGGGVPGASDPRPVPLNAAPVISPSQIQSTPEPSTPPTPATEVPKRAAETLETPPPTAQFLVIAGTHAWLNSARSEARALELIGIVAEVEPLVGGKYRVVVGRYKTRASAEKALGMYEGKGHRFSVVVER